MAKKNAQSVEQTTEENVVTANEEVANLSETEYIILDSYNDAATVPIFDMIKTETVGTMTCEYINVPVQIKDDNGKKVTVYRKCRDAVAIASLSTIGMLGELRKKSLKMLVLGMAKITDAHAQATDKTLKTAKALIKSMYPEYSDNTINKYRRIGLLFSEDITDARNYRYISFIDEDTSVSNLDVILTLFDKFDVEKASVEERRKKVADFYANYIITNRIHLHSSQTDLKKEVHDILNSVDGESKDLDDDKKQPENGQPENGQPENGQPENGQPENGQPENGQPENGQPENGQPENGQPENGQPENGQPENGQPEIKTDSTAETAQHSIATLTIIFKGNKTAQDALAILMEELSKLF